MNDRDRSRIEDALYAARTIAGWVPLYDRNQIELHLIIESGYVRQFEIIGESLRIVRDSDDTAETHLPDIHEWISLRHHLIHEYRDVDLDLLWRYATEDVPKLILELELLLEQ